MRTESKVAACAKTDRRAAERRSLRQYAALPTSVVGPLWVPGERTAVGLPTRHPSNRLTGENMISSGTGRRASHATNRHRSAGSQRAGGHPHLWGALSHHVGMACNSTRRQPTLPNLEESADAWRTGKRRRSAASRPGGICTGVSATQSPLSRGLAKGHPLVGWRDAGAGGDGPTLGPMLSRAPRQPSPRPNLRSGKQRSHPRPSSSIRRHQSIPIGRQSIWTLGHAS